MGWIGIADQTEGRFSLHGFGPDCGFRPIEPSETLLTRGTFVLETRMSPDTRPQDLFGFTRVYPWERSFILKAVPGGGVFVLHKQGPSVQHEALQLPPNDRTDIIRISYSWDTVASWAQLALERPEHDYVLIRDISAPRPFLISDWREAMLGRARMMASDVVFAALSSRVEPVGPAPTLSGDVPVATADGYVPLRRLRAEDRIVTADGKQVSIQSTVRRTVPARGSFAPIRLRAPYLGLVSDIVVAPDQQVVLAGSDVEYIFGRESVLVAARHLVDGRVAYPETSGQLMTYHQLLTARHDILDVAATQLESLYVGRMRRDVRRFEASILAGQPRAQVPEHGRRVSHHIKPFEAITLIDTLAA